MRKRKLKPGQMCLAGALGLVGLSATLWLGGGRLGAQSGFTSPVVVTGEDTGEPGIDIAPGGLIYINAPAGFLAHLPGSASFLFRSSDGGNTWTRTPNGVRDLFPGGGDSDVAIDQENGTIYYTDLWLGSSTVSVSEDQGESWIASPVDGVVVEDRQWLATPGDERVYLATHQIPAGIVVSKSLTGGVGYVFSSVAATVIDQTGCICPSGNIIAEAADVPALVGGDKGKGFLRKPKKKIAKPRKIRGPNQVDPALTDRVGVIYSTSSGGVKFARSTDGAVTFASSIVSQAVGADTTVNFPIVANAGGGHLVAVWLELTGNRTRVRFSDSDNWGTTWTSPRTLVSTGTSVFPWIDARGAKIAVSLYYTSATGTPDTVPETAQWFETYLQSTNGGATFMAGQVVDSIPVKRGPICTRGAGCAEDRELLDFQSVVIDTANRSLLTWTRSIDNRNDTEIRFARQN